MEEKPSTSKSGQYSTIPDVIYSKITHSLSSSSDDDVDFVSSQVIECDIHLKPESPIIAEQLLEDDKVNIADNINEDKKPNSLSLLTVANDENLIEFNEDVGVVVINEDDEEIAAIKAVEEHKALERVNEATIVESNGQSWICGLSKFRT